MNIGTLTHLTEQAEKARVEAARVLADERNNTQKIAQQIEMLRNYRSEYAQQLQTQMQRGIAPSMLNTYRQFLGSLDVAVKQAEQALEVQQSKVSASQRHWLEKQQRWQSFDLLKVRHQQRERQIIEKREQRIADELSMASYLRQQSKA